MKDDVGSRVSKGIAWSDYLADYLASGASHGSAGERAVTLMIRDDLTSWGAFLHDGEGPARTLLADADGADATDATGAPTDHARYGVRAQTLGEFRLSLATSADGWIDVTNAVHWGHGRAQEVLALLLLQRRLLARSEAAATLWPERDEARRAKLLRNALWNLRAALERLNSLTRDRCGMEGARVARLVMRETPQTLRLVATPPATLERRPERRGEELTSPQRSAAMMRVGYGASSESSRSSGSSGSSGIWCDALAFEVACQRAGGATTLEERLHWSQAALTLYTDVFLIGMAGVERASWITAQRARLAERWARLCVDAASALRRMQEPARALELLLTVVERQPHDTEAARHAMTLLASQGRVAEALRLYERARRAFRQAYGSEPEPLRHLAAEIRAGRFLVERPRRDSGAHWRIAPADLEER